MTDAVIVSAVRTPIGTMLMLSVPPAMTADTEPALMRSAANAIA